MDGSALLMSAAMTQGTGPATVRTSLPYTL
jgi:hypothetical protein